MVIIRIKNQNLFRLFKKHPEIAAYYGAEDLDPDSIPKSQKFVMMGMSELQYFFKLPEVFGDERKWRSALSVIKDHYEEVGVPMSEFNVSRFHLGVSDLKIC